MAEGEFHSGNPKPSGNRWGMFHISINLEEALLLKNHQPSANGSQVVERGSAPEKEFDSICRKSHTSGIEIGWRTRTDGSHYRMLLRAAGE